MHLDKVATVFFVRPLHATGVVKPAPGIPILMYHRVADDEERGVAAYYRLAVSPARFRRQMHWLRERGYRAISLADAVRRLARPGTDYSRCVVLTFDDGFRDFLTHAWPAIRDFGFTATMFLPTGFIGHARQTFKGRECLTWSEVRELHGEGIEFGSHTVSHRVLNRLPWSEVQRELLDSRLRIEDELQVPISTFAYPFAFPREDGPFIARFREELACQGYSAAVTTVIGRAGRRSDALCLERLPVNNADDETLFEAKLLGAYDWLGAVQSVVRSAKHAVRPTAVTS